MGNACLKDIFGPWILWLRGLKAGQNSSGKGTGVRRFCPWFHAGASSAKSPQSYVSTLWSCAGGLGISFSFWSKRLVCSSSCFQWRGWGQARFREKPKGPSLPESMLRGREHPSFPPKIKWNFSETQGKSQLPGCVCMRTPPSVKTESGRGWGANIGPRAFRLLSVTRQSRSSCNTSSQMFDEPVSQHTHQVTTKCAVRC